MRAGGSGALRCKDEAQHGSECRESRQLVLCARATYGARKVQFRYDIRPPAAAAGGGAGATTASSCGGDAKRSRAAEIIDLS
jgi:hypothetical protein